MTKDEAAQLAQEISDIAKDILLQINNLRIMPNFVEQFFIGMLRRERILLRDVASLLSNNDDDQITSAFIVLRVLLEDFIRVFGIYTSSSMVDEVVKIQADALWHKFKNISQSVKINNDFHSGEHASLYTQDKFDKEKQKILDNPEYDIFFEDKAKFKFKKMPHVADLFEQIRNNVKTNANVHSYVIYKHLTQYVHFSNSTSYLDNDTNVRKFEIDQLAEILLYVYKMLLMEYQFLNIRYTISLNDTKVLEFFRSSTIEV